MEKLTEKNLAFFMDLGGSLARWERAGILEREVQLYNKLAETFDHIYFITYGDAQEQTYQKYLRPNISVLSRITAPDHPLLNVLYELILPFRYWHILSSCRYYKTNQNLGSLGATVAKLFHPRSKLIVRSGYIGSLNAKLSQAPLHIRAYLSAAEFFSYLLCDAALVPSRHNRDILVRKYPFVEKKISVHNNAIDTGLFRKLPLDNKERAYDIIYVARLDKDKNQRLLLEAVKDLNLKVLLVGQGEEESYLKQLATPITERVEFLPKVDNSRLPEYLNRSHLFVFPSLHEGNPKALLEAMACELPIIALDVIGVKNLIENGRTGILLPANTLPKSLAETIRKLLGDTDRQARLGTAARQFVIDHFSFETILQKELHLYETL